MPDRVTVSSADFVRNIGAWQEQALKTPVSITYHGRERLVLLAAELYPPGNRVAGAEGASASPLLDHISDGFIAYSEGQVITNVNRVAESYFGLGRDDLIGRKPEDIFTRLRGSFVLDQIHRVATTRVASTFEVESLLFEGVRLALTAFPLGAGVGVLFANISEQHALKLASERAEALIAGLAKHRHIALIEIDVRGRFTALDEKFARWLGFERAALNNSRLVDLVMAANRSRVADALDLVVSARAPQAVEAHFLSKDHRDPALSVSLAPHQSADGLMRISGAVTTIAAAA